MFLRAIKRSGSAPEDSYPLSLPQIRDIERIEFPLPVTLIAGENGSGKTTLLELIAALTGVVRVGDAAVDGRSRDLIRRAARAFRAEFIRRPKHGFLFLAEDFTRYIDAREASMAEQRAELRRVKEEYRDRSAYARGLAEMPFRSSLYAMESMYENELGQRSHGEGYLDFFGARMVPEGLYLMDEPEGALSWQNQYAMLHMIADGVRDGCQFVICTHSPVLLACPQAALYGFEPDGLRRTTYDALESVRFIRDFLAAPERYLRHVKME